NCSFFSSRRRHTRSKRDWSSDVCSSDLWFTYSLYPHKGNLRECDTVRESYCLNFPALTALHTAMGETASLLSVDQKNVMAETVRSEERRGGTVCSSVCMREDVLHNHSSS